MPSLSFSDKANEDLSGIWRYIAADNQAAADAQVRKLLVAMEMIAELPGLGRLRDDLKGNHRSLTVDNYVIFYKLLPHDEVAIVRVLHGSLDFLKQF